VNSITEVDAGPEAQICNTSGLFDLASSVSHPGGTWSGPGVNGNNFNPATVGTGSYDLQYAFTNAKGCTSTDTRRVVVKLPESINIGANQVICQNSAKIDLDKTISKVGGTWSGPGIESGNFFNPVLAGIGSHVVTYTFNHGSGCISTASKTIRVRETISVDAGLDKSFCKNATGYNLANDASLPGGTWSGPGVSGNNFNPATAGVGNHIIVYTYKDDFGCNAVDNRIFSVTEIINVNAGSDISVCSDAGVVDLTNIGFPTGGTWSGSGIETSNSFNPSSVGPGDYTITYRYSDENGCMATDEKVITVSAPLAVDAGSDFEICVNASPLTLLGAKPQGGNWSGSGVIGGVFDALSAGLGEKQLTYTFKDQSGCVKSDLITVNVLPEPVLMVGGNISLCSNVSPINLATDASIKGGTWIGKGVTGTMFNPETAGPGMHVITYSVRYNGCDLNAFRNITVNGSEKIEVGPNLTMCVESNDYDLVKDVNVVGGTWNGPGLSGSVFKPSLAGVGSHVLTYTFKNAFGCVSSDFRVITVQKELPINAGDDLTLCSGVTSFDLTGRGLPEGGVFVGPGVQKNKFDPSITGNGSFIIEYVVNNGNGCISRDNLVITVKSSSITDFGKDAILCITNTPLELNFNEELRSGNWSGTGVVSNVFYPALAGIGSHSINYTNQGIDCDIVGRRTLTVVALPEDATAVSKNATACEGAFITLKAKLSDNDRVNNTTIHWYREGEENNPIAKGEEILFEVRATEKIYYSSINQYGCSSGQKDYIDVRTNNPSANIEVNENRIGFGKAVQFFASNARNAESYKWDFGDGFTSYRKNPHHYYYTSGKLDVTLQLTSADGCVTTILAEDIVEVLQEPGREELKKELEEVGRVGTPEVEIITYRPNPHHNELTVDLISPHAVVYEVIAINTMQVPTSLGLVSLSEGKNTFTINCEILPAGIYVFKLIGPTETFTFKTVKQ
jgi:hypothetical protein